MRTASRPVYIFLKIARKFKLKCSETEKTYKINHMQFYVDIHVEKL